MVEGVVKSVLYHLRADAVHSVLVAHPVAPGDVPLAAFLAREMPRVRLIEPEGTYLLWLDFRAYGLSAHELDDIIVHQAKLWLDSGHIFGADGEGFERLNIACPWQTLARGLAQLTAAFRDR